MQKDILLGNVWQCALGSSFLFFYFLHSEKNCQLRNVGRASFEQRAKKELKHLLAKLSLPAQPPQALTTRPLPSLSLSLAESDTVALDPSATGLLEGMGLDGDTLAPMETDEPTAGTSDPKTKSKLTPAMATRIKQIKPLLSGEDIRSFVFSFSHQIQHCAVRISALVKKDIGNIQPHTFTF